MSRRKKAKLPAADVLIAFDVLIALGMDEEAVRMLSIAGVTDEGVKRIVIDGAIEADQRAVMRMSP